MFKCICITNHWQNITFSINHNSENDDIGKERNKGGERQREMKKQRIRSVFFKVLTKYNVFKAVLTQKRLTQHQGKRKKRQREIYKSQKCEISLQFF